MTDEIIAPLMDDNNAQEGNEISPEYINNNDNENQALLNNNEIIRGEIINNRELTNQQKRCLILLSFIIQLILFFLSIYFLSDYINNLNPIIINIIFFISMIIIAYLTFIHFSRNELLMYGPYLRQTQRNNKITSFNCNNNCNNINIWYVFYFI